MRFPCEARIKINYSHFAGGGGGSLHPNNEIVMHKRINDFSIFTKTRLSHKYNSKNMIQKQLIVNKR